MALVPLAVGAGNWQKLQRALLDCSGQHNAIAFTRTALDSAAVAAKRTGSAVGPNPTDRGKAGSTCHVVTDVNSISFAHQAEPTHTAQALEQAECGQRSMNIAAAATP